MGRVIYNIKALSVVIPMTINNFQKVDPVSRKTVHSYIEMHVMSSIQFAQKKENLVIKLRKDIWREKNMKD